ncbi:MAG TPA: Hsp20/alpha crystallin family protein [Candidatus Polarisedimenticolia bacterium]|nr:Hsp20/alpha crystallin family protein [Candidatus Polarisedimenticolia bacterium]
MKPSYTPVDEMFDLFRDFDGLFRRTFSGFRELPGELSGMRRLLPAGEPKEEFYFPVECFTKDKQIIFRAELPGVDAGQTEVCILGDQLVIKGEKKEMKKIDEKDLFFQEISRGKFERRFSLPAGVKKDQVKATFDNGILEVMLPAESIETARKVPIEITEGGKKAVRAA